jgi:hypothetical protein
VQQEESVHIELNPSIEKIKKDLEAMEQLMVKLWVLTELETPENQEKITSARQGLTPREKQLIASATSDEGYINEDRLTEDWLCRFRRVSGKWEGPLFADKSPLESVRAQVPNIEPPAFVEFDGGRIATITCGNEAPVEVQVNFLTSAIWMLMRNLWEFVE